MADTEPLRTADLPVTEVIDSLVVNRGVDTYRAHPDVLGTQMMSAGPLAQAVRAAALGYITLESWDDLEIVIGVRDSQAARVRNTDLGTHEDPVSSEVVPNAGEYSWVSGESAWTRVGDNQGSDFVPALNDGSGSPNAIIATSELPITENTLVLLPISEGNTDPLVTVSFNGGADLTIKLNGGGDPQPGDLPAGRAVLGRVTGSIFGLVSDQASSAVLAAAEDAANAALAAANSNYTFDTVSLASAASIPAVINSVIIRGRDAADDGIFSVYVDTDNGSADTFVSSGADARTWYRVEAMGDRWAPSLPFRSNIDRIRENGITPDDVVGAIVSGDAGPAIAGMFEEGISQGINLFKFMNGKTYEVDSWDASDSSHAYGILRTAETSDIIIDLNGGTWKGLPGIQESTANPGAIARFVSAHTTNGEDTTQRFILRNGKVDLTDCPTSVPGITTIGGLSIEARWNIELDSVLFDHGRTTPSGDAIGVGGGDQSFFASNWNSLKINKCIFRGAPDLGVYLSNSGGRRADIFLSQFIGCQNAIGLKRFASLLRVSGCQIREGDIGIYNPSADGLADNMGGRMDIKHCLIEKMQSRPIEINALADGSSVRNTEIWDWGRRLSDGAMNSISESIGAIRSRSRQVVTQNVRIGMRDWALNGTLAGETAGKEQVGIVYGYNGASGTGLPAGAEDCSHSDCYFQNLYRRVRYEANTFRNANGNGNIGYNISQSDLDSGDNIFPIRLTDDAATSILMPSNRCAVHIECLTTTNGSPNGEVHVNTTGSPAVVDISLKSTTNIVFTTGVLGAAGGTDANMNLSAHTDGKFYISNRTGSTVIMRVTFPRE